MEHPHHVEHEISVSVTVRIEHLPCNFEPTNHYNEQSNGENRDVQIDCVSFKSLTRVQVLRKADQRTRKPGVHGQSNNLRVNQRHAHHVVVKHVGACLTVFQNFRHQELDHAVVFDAACSVRLFHQIGRPRQGHPPRRLVLQLARRVLENLLLRLSKQAVLDQVVVRRVQMFHPLATSDGAERKREVEVAHQRPPNQRPLRVRAFDARAR
mmetsp:Transcript_9618/g.18114  ORF Transcript_9618/g.18114 Transcript_9618/m.18114 type:complete len:210 (-) Transcript_9618:531-1160(-)